MALLARLIAQHMYHMRSLNLTIWPESHDDALTAALCTPAPLLESFTIYAYELDKIELPERVFGGVAPVLRSVKLSFARLPLRCPGLSCVSRLQVDLPREPMVSPYPLSHVFPHLKTLVLTYLDYGVHYGMADTHMLEHLTIEVAHTPRWPGSIDVSAQLQALNHHRIAYIEVQQGLERTIDESTSVELVLGSITHDLDTYTWPHARLHRHPLPPFNAAPGRLANATRFDVAYNLLSVVPPHIPSARHLCVELARLHKEFDYERLAQWLELKRTPRLESLIFSGRGGQLRVPLRAALLVPAILSRGSQLCMLSMDCVYFEEDQEIVLSLLQPTADTFLWSPPA
ncbi:hypothetical protein AURDEDRAFT_162174 [Auricularia subglabra TFB-10046 SS5]|nr:hypothetical protein AURDEDRAFT_162174 [Auricularia subglabra TFB-10046 SS5]